ncbi:hypothetical protein MNV49_006957 [Pseudohyphozyma bogoriensis]|nr:hypothetical protein MNV49_006957 [Pseudohyphozyma bogoriensis]
MNSKPPEKKASFSSRMQSSVMGAPSNLKDWHAQSKGPSTKYMPSRPGDRLKTAEELQAGSSILAAQRAHAEAHRPPPPPMRGRQASYGSTASSEAPAPTSSYSRPAPAASAPRSTPAPPYSHAAKHDLPSQLAGMSIGGGARPKPFSQYDENDKQEFFGMLDEASIVIPTPTSTPTPPAAAAPPRAPLSTRPPPLSTASSYASSTPSFTADPSLPSYPPPQPHGSSAETLLHYILHTPSQPLWFLDPSPTPPPIKGRNDIRWTGSWSQCNDQKQCVGFVLFGDTSCCWYSIEWSARDEKGARLGDHNIRREGRYRPIAGGWDGEKLYNASETYGPAVADFARRAVAGRRPIGNGECWTLAAEALNEVEARGGVPKPWPSIGRTHGMVLFWGRAGGSGGGMGEWRAEDVYVRPGDIVEWRKVTIRTVGMQRGAYAKLGDPDHTAVILSASPPSTPPTPNSPFPIASLVSLTVVEQSAGKVPTEAEYDMSAMTEGEVWIYRPAGLVDMVGTEVRADWPPSCESWEV